MCKFHVMDIFADKVNAIISEQMNYHEGAKGDYE